MAVGGSSNGCAEDNSCSASANATASAAAWALNPLVETRAGSGESDASACAVESVSVADSFSAVKRVSKIIISHNKRIAQKTSPMPRAVIWRDWINASFMFISI